MDKDISITSLELAPKIRDSQIYERYDVAPLSPRNGRTQYGKGQKSEDNRKGKRCGENRKGEWGGRGHWENKVDRVVEENSDFEASDYYHIIY